MYNGNYYLFVPFIQVHSKGLKLGIYAGVFEWCKTIKQLGGGGGGGPFQNMY